MFHHQILVCKCASSLVWLTKTHKGVAAWALNIVGNGATFGKISAAVQVGVVVAVGIEIHSLRRIRTKMDEDSLLRVRRALCSNAGRSQVSFGPIPSS